MNQLDAIRQKIKALDEKKQGKNQKGGDKLTYTFWNMKDGETAQIRFLPDGNEDNTFFWVEKQTIRLTFPGVKGGDSHKEVTVTVPCMDMYGEQCPIIAETRPWWNDEDLKEMAQKYYKKREFIFQGLVRVNPLTDDEPENPIRKFVFTSPIFNLIKASLMDPDMANIPTDPINGTDFRLVKGTKGKWADYSTSAWARRESSLTQDELDAVQKYGLKDLSTYLPKKPTAEEVAIIYEMFQDSVNGELYDPVKYAKYYKPYGMEWSENKVAVERAQEPVVRVEQKETVVAEVSDDIPFDGDDVSTTVTETASAAAVSSPSTQGKSAEDILAMLRNRKS